MGDTHMSTTGQDKKKSTVARNLGRFATALGLRVLARWVYEVLFN